jgi:monoamine oxidase
VNYMSDKNSVIVIGAGAAGMSAAVELAEAGFAVSILEARERIGGRMFTQRDPAIDAPIELGAEFIHGKPQETWKLLQAHNVPITEVDGDSWCVTENGLTSCDFFSDVDKILEKMSEHDPDESFLYFLERCFSSDGHDTKLEEAKRRAIRYVSGFNAADPGLVGTQWLVKEMRAEEQIEGERAFHAGNGYADLVAIFRERMAKNRVSIETETVVERVKWKAGAAEIFAPSPRGAVTLAAARVLVTVPLGVLQADAGNIGALEFVPGLPARKREAMRKLEMGKVIRVVLRFRHRFWDDIRPTKSKDLSSMSFLLSDDEWFPTWWTTVPRKLPLLTGWAPFEAGERLSGKSCDFVTEKSLETLHHLLGVSKEDLEGEFEAAYFHDWQSDPFSRGAYSYGKIGANAAQEELARPLEGTLFFAGEATDLTGNNGTVHGAIASGQRAAKEIVQSFTSRRK